MKVIPIIIIIQIMIINLTIKETLIMITMNLSRKNQIEQL
jgi:hypothetical protein